jgi:formylglycine-generating enzyme required for sulfatase activity
MQVAFALAGILLALLFGAAPGHAQTRVALVIGNSRYTHVPALPNPANDAADIGASLERLGFAVRRITNGTSEDMRLAVRDFLPQTRRAEMAVIFFAGHGIEIGGENWLIPVDAELNEDISVEQEAIALRSLVPVVGAASKLGLIILDACRNNPFMVRMQRRLPVRAVGRGLTRVEPTGSVLVAYAAKDGTTASDGPGRNSPFTSALLRYIETPGLEVNYLFRNVREAVLNATNFRQEPVVYGALPSAEIYFKRGTEPAVAVVTPVDTDPAGRVWKTTQNTASVAVLEDFIRQFGDTPYGAMARARLDEMRKEITSLASPVSPEPSAPRAKLTAVVPPTAPTVPSVACESGRISVSMPSRMSVPLTANEECALRPGDVFKECSRCPEMVVLPAGAFTMGSAESEKDHIEEESPQHEVTFARQFAVGRFHVTVDQFAVFVAETGYDTGSKCQTFEGGKLEERRGRSWRSPGFTQHGSHPVVCLNWNDAKAYADWLARKTGKAYRLMTEAEWEYAARARTQPGTYPQYWFGDDETELCHYANVADQLAKSIIARTKAWAGASCSDGYAYTAPVGSFAANGFGLHDMLGNASQWTGDCFHDDYAGAPPDGSAWTSGDCRIRPSRGGSWYNFPRNLRAAARIWANASYRLNYLGFRLARTLAR